MDFAANLKRLRKAAKLTQEQLAHACGYSGQSRIGNYEATGEHARLPNLDEIPLIADALGVDIAELFGRSSASDKGSHSVRLDPAMLAETARALRERFEKVGGFDIEKDPETFLRAYEIGAGMGDAYESPEVFRLVIQHADLTPQGAVTDGRSEGVQAQGPAKRNVGSSRGRKA